ncbi:hypothetical protein FZC35_02165 [Candidatus Cytomitobacter indipagum]|uniref:Porin family protein n=1 Tax=Candidatus Cytomitobacter indipagum TaxID=2601575 RepID=A0A5C0UEP3_9PROT|nr:hypothetical protein [Candidatus Cytomitobacter indipagum]QEK38170.1 hypothetical protein FZC35_02165 [Candidatus Cytomitobacter indipagum]
MFLYLFSFAFLSADTGIGIAYGFKNMKNSTIESKSTKQTDMKHNNNFNICLSFNHWRKIQSNIFIGGDINLGFVKNELTHKDENLDLKIGNNNINLEFCIKAGLGNNRAKLYLGPVICATRFSPKIVYLNKHIDTLEKNILTPFFGFRGGISFMTISKLSLDIYYTYGFSDKKRLESSSFGIKSISEFDSEFFKFKPSLSRVGFAAHYRI